MWCRLEHVVAGRAGASNNWARGYHTDGLTMANSILDVARREAENCDCLQGIQMVHALGGGTGGGLGSLLLDQIRDEYPDRIIASYCVVPSPKVFTAAHRRPIHYKHTLKNEKQNKKNSTINIYNGQKKSTMKNTYKTRKNEQFRPPDYVLLLMHFSYQVAKAQEQAA